MRTRQPITASVLCVPLLVFACTSCSDSSESGAENGKGQVDFVAEGRALLTEGNSREAIAKFNARLAQNKLDSEALFHRAKAFVQTKQFNKAVDDLILVTRGNSSNFDAHYQLGAVYRHLGKNGDALASFSRAIQHKRDFVQAYIDRSATHFNLGDVQAAISDCDEALRLDPNNGPTWVNRGIYHSRIQQNDLARKDWDTAIRVAPQFFGGYFSRGVDRGINQDFEGALQDMAKVLELEPEHIAARQNRGSAFLALERLEDAIGEFNLVIAKAPNSPIAYEKRAECYRALGRDRDATADEAKAAQIRAQPANTAR